MSDNGESFPSASARIKAEAAAMFIEVQRADVKATTLCGVTGGLLAVDAAVLSGVSKSGWLPAAALACAAAFLGTALVVAVVAIRPILPRSGELRVFACWPAGSDQLQGISSAIEAMGSREYLQAEVERLTMFTALARRKFRAVRWAADFTVAAVAMAGIGLLSLYITV
ncbi:Pycsar system effector family protein [Streptomyces sp. NPDC101213]|uniref:Pycsar system effector family protein n=1 Tax=Streptomyces sp. NPDC101213 TaxID=3366130 RepID=UPI0038136A25